MKRLPTLGLCGLALGAGAVVCAGEPDPPYYVRGETWQESLEQSSAALDRVAAPDSFAPYSSGVLRGGDPAQHVSIPLEAAEVLYLFVTGVPDNASGIGNWADAVLVTGSGERVPAGGLEGLTVLRGRCERDLSLRAGLYQPIQIEERRFTHGLCVQADSVVRLPLDGRFTRFESWIGVDASVGRAGHLRFAVTGEKTAARKRLWGLLERDFSGGTARQQMRWEREDRIWEATEPLTPASLASRYAEATKRILALAAQARKAAAAVSTPAQLGAVRELYHRSRVLGAAIERGRAFDGVALRLAITDLRDTFGPRYPEGDAYLRRFAEGARELAAALRRWDAAGSLAEAQAVAQAVDSLEALRREALLANPLLDFGQLLVVRRRPIGDPRRSEWADRGLGEYLGLPRQSSWGHSTMPKVEGWENDIALLSPVGTEGVLTTLYRPDEGRLVSDIDLRHDADRLLFAMPDRDRRWQVWELKAEGDGLRQLTPGDQPEVHSYDACYLPNGDIAFISTAPLQGVPCNAGVVVGMMYVMDAEGRQVRQVCFEQDHDYCPTVLNDGRVMYLRWDYTDTPHVWNRLLMSMNPDGTGQMELYGSNSYWPNAVFFARPVPGHPSKIVGIVTGHHEGRVGELIVFDPVQGRHEVEGVVQRVPGRGQPVEPRIEDKLTEHSWPKFLHPWPLNEHYFLVSGKPTPDDLWGIYLVDTFDNRVLIREEEGYALLEPIPFRSHPRPPVIPDRTDPDRNDALVYVADIYQGPGLRGVPRGEVKALRVFSYHFGFQRLAGIDHRVGTDGPWEIKQVLGTVPVEADGSALFRVPAKLPLSLQPLDAQGRALALMRSWMTAMPGETLSCGGCHERQAEVAPVRQSLALRRLPAEIRPPPEPVRGFSFARDVQPVLDRSCVGCHDGRTTEAGGARPDLRADQGGYVVYQHGKPELEWIEADSRDALVGRHSGVFDPAYVALRAYVRVGGLESDLHPLPPKEFHANTSELIQMLEKGHHNVRLDEDAWSRLVTWIDLNAPCHGTWSEVTRIPGDQRERRRALRQLYGGRDEDGEAIPKPMPARPTPVLPEPVTTADRVAISPPDWPLSPDQARAQQRSLGRMTRTVDLGNGVAMEFVRVPAGSFVMGDHEGDADERPPVVRRIERPFWISRFEVTNEQYQRFDPAHDSRFEHRTSWIFSEAYLGWALNRPRQPVVRVSWSEASAFCGWLSAQVGSAADLPSEAQWEYACRAGNAGPFFFGDCDDDFSRWANLADVTLRDLAQEGWRPRAPDLVPRDDRFDDGVLVTSDVGTYQPNVWGLHDMHGNAAEWTRSDYAPYDRPVDLRMGDEALRLKVVRGGSWRDRPRRARASFRLAYPAYQKVFNVGFRVVLEDTLTASVDTLPVHEVPPR